MDHKSWRADRFENYKYKRKEKRKASKTDWAKTYEMLNAISDEIKEFMPWHVLHVPGAEGDDCIAAMTKRTQEFGQHEPVLIIAADNDYTQLLKYDNVEQFSIKTKKMVTGKDPAQWLLEGIAKGQRKDGIPNIKSPDDVFVTGGRQSAVSAKLIQEIKDQGPEAALSQLELRNWKRNELLMSFDRIPEEITNRIWDAYDNYQPADFGGVLNYLMERRCKNLIGNIADLKPGE
jgi:hypothetical protein